jgi:DNA polymerase III epsilon subunit-like protein
MTEFPVLSKKVAPAELVVFFDFEGTQFSHKAIAVGINAYEKNAGDLFPLNGEVISYKAYIQTRDKIGPVVKKMTGIDEGLLKKEGKPFATVIKEIINLTRNYPKKVYISYGEMDLKILFGSLNFHDDYQASFFRHVTRNYLDFHEYISRFLIDENGQSLSIEKLLNYYHLMEKGSAHDSLFDSKALMDIFLSYIKSPNRTIDEVIATYGNNRNVKNINRELVLKLIRKGKVEYSDLKEAIANTL